MALPLDKPNDDNDDDDGDDASWWVSTGELA